MHEIYFYQNYFKVKFQENEFDKNIINKLKWKYQINIKNLIQLF